MITVITSQIFGGLIILVCEHYVSYRIRTSVCNYSIEGITTF